MNRYWIDLQREGDVEWRFCTECGEAMTLPEMVLQSLDVLKLTEAAAVRIRCQQTPDRGASTIHQVAAQHREEEQERWRKKLAKYQASQENAELERAEREVVG